MAVAESYRTLNHNAIALSMETLGWAHCVSVYSFETDEVLIRARRRYHGPDSPIVRVSMQRVQRLDSSLCGFIDACLRYGQEWYEGYEHALKTYAARIKHP